MSELSESVPAGSTSVRKGPSNPAAFWLSLAGLAIQGVAALMVVTFYSVYPRFGYGMFGMMGGYGGMMGPYFGAGWYGWTWVWVAVAAVALILGVLGVIWMSSPESGKVRSGSVLVLVAAVGAFPTMWGFWIGSVLMFVGAILGLATSQT